MEQKKKGIPATSVANWLVTVDAVEGSGDEGRIKADATVKVILTSFACRYDELGPYRPVYCVQKGPQWVIEVHPGVHMTSAFCPRLPFNGRLSVQ